MMNLNNFSNISDSNDYPTEQKKGSFLQSHCPSHWYSPHHLSFA